MENLNPFCLILLLTGGVLLLAAAIQYKFPPKKINPFYGYRTKVSMRNQETWDFAQRFSALQMMKVSRAMLVIGGLCWLFNFSPPFPLPIGMGVVILFPLVMILKVEKELKKRFPKDS